MLTNKSLGAIYDYKKKKGRNIKKKRKNDNISDNKVLENRINFCWKLNITMMGG